MLIKIIVSVLIIASSQPVTAKHSFECPVLEGSRTEQNLLSRKILEPNSKQNWPSTYLLMGGRGPCTATRVGPRVLFTAAHCISSNGSMRAGRELFQDTTMDEFELDKSFEVQCEMHNKYKINHKYDYALCEIAEHQSPHLETGHTTIEIIDRNTTSISIGDKLTHPGYGCVSGSGHRSAIQPLHNGSSFISTLPTEAEPFIQTNGGALLCTGDSGGAAYKEILTENGGKQRSIVGVNSKVCDNTGLNLFVATSNKEFLDWAEGWISGGKKVDRSICGISDNDKGCRDIAIHPVAGISNNQAQ